MNREPFSRHIAPELLRIWRVRESGVRLTLGENFDRYARALSLEQLRTVILPEVRLFAFVLHKTEK